MKNNINAIVVTYNSAKYLPLCVRALRNNGINKIVVIDNNSIDNTVEKGTKMGLFMIPLKKNIGFARACNAGARQCSSKYLLFINPDAIIDKKAVQKALQDMLLDEKVGIVGLSLRSPTNSLEKENFGKSTSLAYFLKRQFISTKPLQKSERVGWVSGGAMLVDRLLFNSLSGFDGRFFMYWEDVDLCKRVTNSGRSVVFNPSAGVVHYRGMSLLDQKKKTKIYDKSADRFFYKHYAKSIWLLHRFLRYIYRLFSPHVS